MTQIRSFFATAPKGMESVLADELRGMGASGVVEERGGVRFQGPLAMGYRACLWSRTAGRVLLPLKQFPAPDQAKLYGGVKSIRWSDHLTPERTLAVDFTSTRSAITHTQFGALKVKDAIVDQFRSITGVRPSVDLKQPDVRINVHVVEDQATLSLDLSGDSLHKRGYRQEGVYAPLKENLAAAILLHCDWPALAARGAAFIDPMCGSGTMPIEAAFIATDRAPGLGRKYFGFEKWLGHDAGAWQELLNEARERHAKRIAVKKTLPTIVGYDRDPRAVRSAIENIEAAGLHGFVHVEKRELEACTSIAQSGLVVLNPPYGERLGEVEELKPLYKQIGDTFKQRFAGWEGAVFTGNMDLAKHIGLKPSRRIVLFNGPIECRLFRFPLYSGRA
jgi:23S rRNA (guanine2445-N2)-methyltransferase / 23S rRNA (guanine2069-N7)-methyltransferase